MYRRHRNFISVDIMCLTNHGINPPCFHVAFYGWVQVWYMGFQPTLMSSLASLRTLKIKSVLGIWKRKMSSRAVYDPLAVGRSMSFILISKKKKASGHLQSLPFLIDNSDSKSFSSLQMGTLLGDTTTTYIDLSAWYQSLFSVPPFIPGTQKITQQSFWNMFQLCDMVKI